MFAVEVLVQIFLQARLEVHAKPGVDPMGLVPERLAQHPTGIRVEGHSLESGLIAATAAVLSPRCQIMQRWTTVLELWILEDLDKVSCACSPMLLVFCIDPLKPATLWVVEPNARLAQFGGPKAILEIEMQRLGLSQRNAEQQQPEHLVAHVGAALDEIDECA